MRGRERPGHARPAASGAEERAAVWRLFRPRLPGSGAAHQTGSRVGVALLTVTGAMRDGERGVFESDAWRPALEKYAGVTHLTVALYDAVGHAVCGPINPTTSLFELFAQYQYDSGLFSECAQRCLERSDERSAI